MMILLAVSKFRRIAGVIWDGWGFQNKAVQASVDEMTRAHLQTGWEEMMRRAMEGVRGVRESTSQPASNLLYVVI